MKYELYFIVLMAVIGIGLLAKETIKAIYEDFKPDIERFFKKREKDE